jgi:hypothetical protein
MDKVTLHLYRENFLLYILQAFDNISLQLIELLFYVVQHIEQVHTFLLPRLIYLNRTSHPLHLALISSVVVYQYCTITLHTPEILYVLASYISHINKFLFFTFRYCTCPIQDNFGHGFFRLILTDDTKFNTNCIIRIPSDVVLMFPLSLFFQGEKLLFSQDHCRKSMQSS